MRRLSAAVMVVALVVGLTASGTAAQASAATGKPVVIANGWSASDVGTAAPLAARLGGSVLYANRDGLGAATVNALATLAPSEVVLVGGTAALTEAVETELGSAASGASVSRLAGEGRRHTAALAALRNPAVGKPVVIANGWSASDVGIAAPLAAKLGGSVLYSGEDSLGAKTVDALGELAPSEVVLVGGTGVLAGTVETELATVVAGVGIGRIVGDDRLHRAALAALRDPAIGKPVVIANGSSAPDVGTAAPLAAALGGSVLYANSASLNAHTIDALERLNPAQVVLIGGTAALTADTVKELARTLPDAALQRVAGTDRIDTAAQAALRQYQPANTPAATTSTASVTKLTAISAGLNHSCGIRTDGTATCWGNNRSGKADPPDGKFTAISAGFLHSCGLRTDGTAVCWGDNRAGRADAPGGKFTAISAGELHSCGIRADGTAVCWGNNGHGLADLPGGKFTAISAGINLFCGIRTDGTAVCWGPVRPLADAPDGKFTAISTGWGGHACGVRVDGTATCWGNNGSGQADVPGGKFTAISPGESHSCGIRTDGTATCWGNNNNGQAGAPGGKFTAISAGINHSCGIRTDGTAVCWGYRSLRQVPGSKFIAVSATGAPCGVRVDGTALCWGFSKWAYRLRVPDGKFTAVSAEVTYACGIRVDGTAVCWGVGEFGQADPPDGKFTAISAGNDHACGLRVDGTAVCWGRDTYPIDSHFCSVDGQPAICVEYEDGVTDAPDGKFTAISTGLSYSCGIRTDGTAVCWGDNHNGQTGAPGGKFTAISTGWRHSCGLRVDGTAVCWGHNGHGLADLPGGKFTAISAGVDTACGLRVDGTAVCWGDNSHGQADLPGGKFTAISAGSDNACGVRIDGAVVCWGDESHILGG